MSHTLADVRNGDTVEYYGRTFVANGEPYEDDDRTDGITYLHVPTDFQTGPKYVSVIAPADTPVTIVCGVNR